MPEAQELKLYIDSFGNHQCFRYYTVPPNFFNFQVHFQQSTNFISYLEVELTVRGDPFTQMHKDVCVKRNPKAYFILQILN